MIYAKKGRWEEANAEVEPGEKLNALDDLQVTRLGRWADANVIMNAIK